MSAGRNAAFTAGFAAALASAGVRHVVICPGSRSSPLALALAESPALRVWMHVDERSAGFFALGLARQAREPVALLCSSGTAGANFFPAVIEAGLSRIPLVVLTADRPPELRDVGAPQTIDQVGLYGRAAKWFVDLPVPDALPDPAAYAATIAARAVATATAAPAGPVHCNVPFREPLLDAVDGVVPSVAVPRIRVDAAPRTLGADSVRDLARTLAGASRVALVCGPHDDPDFAAAIAALAAALDAPIFADALSQVRCGPHDRSHVVDAYDVFLRDETCRERFAPDLVLRFGALPTSKVLWERLTALDGAQILVDGGDGWRDPLARVTQVVHADATLLCRALATAIDAPADAERAAWTRSWLDLDARTAHALDAAVESDDAIFEGRVFTELARALPAGTTLVAGNSMPVRDLDAFFRGSDRALRFASNRGANGIDGVVSSALGAAAAGAPVVLVVGDLSFFHDANGLLAARLNAIDATIVVVNNDGGGIFSFLPQASLVERDRFEQLFGTPTGLDPARVAAVYDASFVRAETWPAFRAALDGARRTRGLSIVEVRTERTANVRRHRELWSAVARALHAPATVS
jgi:2-succinyl-5-enolpyruvyl-6-hydroxy-3-cyclohexene-1-carboxylate synthase